MYFEFEIIEKSSNNCATVNANGRLSAIHAMRYQPITVRALSAKKNLWLCVRHSRISWHLTFIVCGKYHEICIVEKKTPLEAKNRASIFSSYRLFLYDVPKAKLFSRRIPLNTKINEKRDRELFDQSPATSRAATIADIQNRMEKAADWVPIWIFSLLEMYACNFDSERTVSCVLCIDRHLRTTPK